MARKAVSTGFSTAAYLTEIKLNITLRLRGRAAAKRPQEQP